MKKIKWTIMTLTILLSVGGAMASRFQQPGCAQLTQYWFDGANYHLAGKQGANYICESSANVCTYTYNGVVYTPCQMGSYFPCQGCIVEKFAPRKKK
jgi:hypothetical protein